MWIYDTISYELIESKKITNYNIFSISINRYYIATCGETGFTIFDKEYNILYEKIGDGEYHGVALDKDELYVCNRLYNRIEKFKIVKISNE